MKWSFCMKSSRCVLILIYLISYIVSVNTTNKLWVIYCDMFRPHRAIIRLTKKCLWTLIITSCLRAFEISNGLQFFITYNLVCSGGACVCACVAVSCRSFSLLASSVCLLNWLLTGGWGGGGVVVSLLLLCVLLNLVTSWYSFVGWLLASAVRWWVGSCPFVVHFLLGRAAPHYI